MDRLGEKIQHVGDAGGLGGFSTRAQPGQACQEGRFHSKFWPLSQGPCMSHLFWWKSSSQAMNYALCVPVIGLPVSTRPSRCRSKVRCSGKLPASSPGCPLFALRASRADLYCHRHRAVTLCIPVSVYLNGRRHQVIFIFDFSASYTPGL